MKKLNVISFIAVLLSFVGLVLLRFTKMPAHIAISGVALIIMIVCTVLGRKSWKAAGLEITYRAAYLIALVTGILMVAAGLSGTISIVHKIAAAVFAALYIVSFIVNAKKNAD